MTEPQPYLGLEFFERLLREQGYTGEVPEYDPDHPENGVKVRVPTKEGKVLEFTLTKVKLWD